MNMQRGKHFFAVTAIVMGLTACVSAGDPPEQLLSEARSDVKTAKETGASEYAPLALRAAENQLHEAESAIQEKEYEEAVLLLEKSLANSALAVAQTNAAKSEAAAKEVDESIDTLKQVLQEE